MWQRPAPAPRSSPRACPCREALARDRQHSSHGPEHTANGLTTRPRTRTLEVAMRATPHAGWCSLVSASRRAPARTRPRRSRPRRWSTSRHSLHPMNPRSRRSLAQIRPGGPRRDRGARSRCTLFTASAQRRAGAGDRRRDRGAPGRRELHVPRGLSSGPATGPIFHVHWDGCGDWRPRMDRSGSGQPRDGRRACDRVSAERIWGPV